MNILKRIKEIGLEVCGRKEVTKGKGIEKKNAPKYQTKL